MDVIVLAFLDLSLDVGDDCQLFIVLSAFHAVVAEIFVDLPVFQAFLPVADQAEHLVAISYESFSLVDVYILLRKKSVVFKCDRRNVLEVILLRKFLQTVSDLEDAASFLDLADHLSNDIKKWIVLDQLSVVWSAFLAIDHQHQVERGEQSHA